MTEEAKRFPRIKPEGIEPTEREAEKAELKLVDEQITPEVNAETDEDLGPGDVKGHINKLMDKAQMLALQKLEKILTDVNSIVTAEDAIDIVMKLADMKLTQHWTKKLEKAILKNPSHLNPSKHSPTLMKLQGYVGRVKKVQAGDGRDSGTKLRNQAEDLPSDE